MSTLIIFGIFMMAAFYSGYFIGYYKQEGKPPEIPIVSNISNLVEKASEAKKQPDKEEEKANSFFN